jgi:hypothetical protein
MINSPATQPIAQVSNNCYSAAGARVLMIVVPAPVVPSKDVPLDAIDKHFNDLHCHATDAAQSAATVNNLAASIWGLSGSPQPTRAQNDPSELLTILATRHQGALGKAFRESTSYSTIMENRCGLQHEHRTTTRESGLLVVGNDSSPAAVFATQTCAVEGGKCATANCVAKIRISTTSIPAARFIVTYTPCVEWDPIGMTARKNTAMQAPLQLNTQGGVYLLVVVVQHQGSSANYGHYISTVTCPSRIPCIEPSADVVHCNGSKITKCDAHFESGNLTVYQRQELLIVPKDDWWPAVIERSRAISCHAPGHPAYDAFIQRPTVEFPSLFIGECVTAWSNTLHRPVVVKALHVGLVSGDNVPLAIVTPADENDPLAAWFAPAALIRTIVPEDVSSAADNAPPMKKPRAENQ